MSIIKKPIPTDNPSGALIGFNNLLVDVDSGNNVGSEKALTPNTYERFVDSGGFYENRFTLAASADINFVAIAAHTLVGEPLSIQTAQTAGGALTDLIGFTPVDNSPIMLIFDTINVREIALVGNTSGTTELGVISAGTALQMPRNIYGGHTPIDLSSKTEYQSVRSESGQFLGKTIIRKGSEADYNWQFLDDQFIRDEFKPFIESAKTLPFFIKYRPDFYPETVAYGEVNDDIIPVNMGGGHRRMSVSFNLEAHADI